jgi:pilus assembly protein FimV
VAPTPASAATPLPTAASAPVAVVVPVPVAVPASVPALPMAASAPPLVVPAGSAEVASAVQAAASVAKGPASAASVAKPSAASPGTGDQGVLGSLLEDNPTALGLGGLAVALLAGFGIYRFSRRARKDSGETSFLESRLQPDSFFGASGGQRIDTRDAGGASSSMSYSLSQLDAIGDVDPVAEADVYLAYGRDLQAEEILKEAMRSTPDRMAIRTKLLEVYAKRRDTKGFELLATQLFALTRGEGEDWAKAQELGAQIDPENPMFKPGGAPVSAHGIGGEIIEPLGASTMPQSVLPTPSQFGPSVTAVLARDVEDSEVDLDLDLGDPDTGSPTSPSPLEPSVVHPAMAAPQDDMSLDFSLPDSFAPPATAAGSAVPAEAFDLGDISFDLDMPETLPGAPASAAVPLSGFGDVDLPPLDGDADPMSRKLDLAEEFRQIGDTDGARDLLKEVVAKATGAVKTRAESMLADLG